MVPQSWTDLGKVDSEDRGTADCLCIVEVRPGVLKLGTMCGVVGWDCDPPPPLPGPGPVIHSLLRHSVLLVSILSPARSHRGRRGPDLR